jgi:hypothetical protein
MTSTAEEVIRREAQVWAALVAGDVAADASLLADDFLGVYASGFAGKTDHTDQLLDGPSVAAFDLSEMRVLELTPQVVLLSYRARLVRPQGSSGSPGEPEEMYVSSVWQRRDGRWCNVFSQDTAAQG